MKEDARRQTEKTEESYLGRSPRFVGAIIPHQLALVFKPCLEHDKPTCPKSSLRIPSSRRIYCETRSDLDIKHNTKSNICRPNKTHVTEPCAKRTTTKELHNTKKTCIKRGWSKFSRFSASTKQFQQPRNECPYIVDFTASNHGQDWPGRVPENKKNHVMSTRECSISETS
ncbi:hypothetical protein AC1031_006809 [Aphanomyces cochlioides]|nr:hypothetical protein AC1031_006809 [Aphanomyces cochlioides]